MAANSSRGDGYAHDSFIQAFVQYYSNGYDQISNKLCSSN